AMTIALSVSMRRMAKRNVIARRLVTVEALGSCTYIATDKTGTLTVNELTARKMLLADETLLDISGEGVAPEGGYLQAGKQIDNLVQQDVQRCAETAVLANEAFLGRRNGFWVTHGDAVDVAFLVMAHKAGLVRQTVESDYAELSTIPYESVKGFSASVNLHNEETVVHVKGAFEHVLAMCDRQLVHGGEVVIDVAQIMAQAHQLAEQGYRVLALADGPVHLPAGEPLSDAHLTGLCFLGLVGLIDPLRKGVAESIDACHQAGISVAMLTGDHPKTALAIARELGLASLENEVVTGQAINQALTQGEATLDRLVRDALVFARVEPQHKLQIVQSLQRQGHFVAVTGDGANDAPALRSSHVGVSMGKKGTDVARETSDMIITDDNFTSIVSGVSEGRVAYANVRKVIFLLLSTGAAEILLFIASLLSGYPLPLTAVQLLWLNLVTQGIQDVALAFEPGEGDELKKPPRSPDEPIFNRLMIERVLITSVVMCLLAYSVFSYFLSIGYEIEQARNELLLLMVLFENIQVFNSRSEQRSLFVHNPMKNRLLFVGVAAALLLHIAAMFTPGLSSVLELQPVKLETGIGLFIAAMSLLLVSEAHKFWLDRKSADTER
ncbi:MAG: HAD-IC family P-type ATPase, partial [Gammaproteobacteria bacterium]|nr:HAD-IC family P-type ATPase [Gammaproteobacteria bacterium]